MQFGKRLLWAGALAVALAIVVSACGSGSDSGGSERTAGTEASEASADGSPFVVLAVVDTSGATKGYGELQRAGLEGTAAYLNDHGGILGHQVEVKVINDNGEPETAASEFVKYMSGGNPEPNLVFPGSSPPDSAALLPLLKRYHLVGIGTTLGEGCREKASSICPTSFLPSAGNAAVFPAIAQFMGKQGYESVGMLVEEGPLGGDQLSELGPALEEEGIRFTAVKFPPGAVDLKPQISQLQSAGVDAIYMDGIAPKPGYAGKGRSELGLVSKIPLVFGPFAGSSDLTELMSAAETKNAYQSTYAVNLPQEHFPGRAPLIKYSEQFGGVTALGVNIAAYPWTDLILARAAAEQAESIEVDPMLEALENLDGEAQQDPLYLSARRIQFTEENHEDSAPGEESSFPVVPVGHLVDGMLQSE